MQLLSQITVTAGERKPVIQLLLGDLSAIPKEHAVDILVVSAFPNDYTPLEGSLFLALQKKGLFVRALAANKEMDLVAQLGCWLSAPLSAEQKSKFHFKKILCFEPHYHSTEPQTIVGNIFRCINTFAFDEDNDEIAMPVLATGYQKVPIQKMLPALLENAVFWLQNGLPLKCIKLVLYRQEQADAALPIFEPVKQRLVKTVQEEIKNISDIPRRPPAVSYPEVAEPETVYAPGNAERHNESTRAAPPVALQPHTAPLPTYDLFISYSHKQTEAVQEFVKAIREKKDALNIFYDRSSIPAGGLWIRKISEAIQNSKSVLCILTPEYSKSDVCWDEFQCAKVMELRTKKSIIKTISFIKDEDMPPMFAIYSYIDCTEADLQKLISSAGEFC
ncbi:toll/interleukin-1 receptor domain-containing protein [Agriterribacter sp.]|uniref:toll/interleukin-1 receptor domain-containing protein n=1 Tax=Agriterribacter sp. TaxID=2821509 RepID=UPI002CD52C18|nr:toll/interleukin-1 receptor domain-containing protein [Agriterribacter sp.]HRO47938.1 toll/interleukin-1 receptor domain-containing protein [Agriterribacter sp.]HRQ18619.1 toll/interleukin-1 receptor domain-containing protein [Agriterribacter sp.]